MRLRDRLRIEALESCRWRGHDMTRVKWDDSMWSQLHDRHTGRAVCKNCGRSVNIRTHPAPNEIDIGGEAVAIDCEVKL